MTVSSQDLKMQYNRLLGQIIELEEAGKSAGNPKYLMLTNQAKQLYQTIASQESIFDIDSWEKAIEFFTQKGQRYCFLYGFDVDNTKYPLLKSSFLRQKWGLMQKTAQKQGNFYDTERISA